MNTHEQLFFEEMEKNGTIARIKRLLDDAALAVQAARKKAVVTLRVTLEAKMGGGFNMEMEVKGTVPPPTKSGAYVFDGTNLVPKQMEFAFGEEPAEEPAEGTDTRTHTDAHGQTRTDTDAQAAGTAAAKRKKGGRA
jgi:hypothetical protein